MSWSHWDRLPLTALHAALARREAQIDAWIDEAGCEGARRAWDFVVNPEDVLDVPCVPRDWREDYCALAGYVRRREWRELSALRARTAA